MEANSQRPSARIGAASRWMETAPRIRIAAINGLARGGGAEVALARDLRVMAEDADLSFVQIA